MALVLAFVCSSVLAEWSRVGNFENGDFYIDRANIADREGHREVWSLMDYHYPKKHGNGQIYRSMRSMLRGDQINTMGMLKDWDPVPPDTPIRGILDLVCRR